jgi:hypothetical protein
MPFSASEKGFFDKLSLAAILMRKIPQTYPALTGQGFLVNLTWKEELYAQPKTPLGP